MKSDIQRHWERKITQGEEGKARWKERFRAGVFSDFYEGFQQPPSWNDEDEFNPINLIYSHIRTQLPELHSRDPRFSLDIKRVNRIVSPDELRLFKGQTMIREALVNETFTREKGSSKVRMFILSAYQHAGWMKVGPSAELELHPQAGKPVLDDRGQPIKMGGSVLKYPDMSVKGYKCVLDWITPDNMVVSEDSGAVYPDEVPWVAQRIILPLQYAKNCPMFEKPVREKLKPTAFTDIELAGSGRTRWFQFWKNESQIEGNDRAKVILYEIYDLEAGKWITIALGADEPLRPFEKFPRGIPDDGPFVNLKFTERIQDEGSDIPGFYPIPEIFNLIGPQNEYNLARNEQSIYRKRHRRKYLAIEKMIDEDQVEKLEDDRDGVWAWAKSGNAFVPVTDGGKPPVITEDIVMYRDEFSEIAMSSPESRGVPKSKTLGQAQLMEIRQRTREGDREGLVKKALGEISRRIDLAITSNPPKEGLVPYRNARGARWMKYSKADFEEIPGEIEYGIVDGSNGPQDLQEEQTTWGTWFAFLKTAPEIFESKLLVEETARRFKITDDELVQEVYRVGKMMLEQMKAAIAAKAGGDGNGAGDPREKFSEGMSSMADMVMNPGRATGTGPNTNRRYA